MIWMLKELNQRVSASGEIDIIFAITRLQRSRYARMFSVSLNGSRKNSIIGDTDEFFIDEPPARSIRREAKEEPLLSARINVRNTTYVND